MTENHPDTETPISGKTDLLLLATSVTDLYGNLLIGQTNDHSVRMSVFSGQYPWHHHPASDETFICLQGILTLEFRDREPVVLLPGQSYTVLKATPHRSHGSGRTVNLSIGLEGRETVFED